MWHIIKTPCTGLPCSRRYDMWRSVRSASVQCVPTRNRSAPSSSAPSRSGIFAKPGIPNACSLTSVSCSRAIRSISRSLNSACPTCSEEAPSPLPCPTSTIGTRAAFAAAA